MTELGTIRFPVDDYDLAATLGSGQAFRWQSSPKGWVSVIGEHWVCLTQRGNQLTAEFTNPADAETIQDRISKYLRLDDPMDRILKSFPKDPPMQAAVKACRGLRLLRQDPWECLAGFICSSTKQIVQIQKIVALLCERFGRPVDAPPGQMAISAFPAVQAIAATSETALRECKLGFRAPYLLGTARQIADGSLMLQHLETLDTSDAREALMRCPGVGRKIADCVLLFAYGRHDAFPVDVWVQKALHRLYFPTASRISLQQLQKFSQSHFGPYGGFAQQYLFHYVRTFLGRTWDSTRSLPTPTATHD